MYLGVSWFIHLDPIPSSFCSAESSFIHFKLNYKVLVRCYIVDFCKYIMDAFRICMSLLCCS